LANVTYYYFKECLKILNSKNVSTFNFILDESSHEIINNLKDWRDLYNHIYLRLFKLKGYEDKVLNYENYDLISLQINNDYLNVEV
jgi:RNA binding exosome subunit